MFHQLCNIIPNIYIDQSMCVHINQDTDSNVKEFSEIECHL